MGFRSLPQTSCGTLLTPGSKIRRCRRVSGVRNARTAKNRLRIPAFSIRHNRTLIARQRANAESKIMEQWIVKAVSESFQNIFRDFQIGAISAKNADPERQ
jgi:hypothetical protein